MDEQNDTRCNLPVLLRQNITTAGMSLDQSNSWTRANCGIIQHILYTIEVRDFSLIPNNSNWTSVVTQFVPGYSLILMARVWSHKWDNMQQASVVLAVLCKSATQTWTPPWKHISENVKLINSYFNHTCTVTGLSGTDLYLCTILESNCPAAQQQKEQAKRLILGDTTL